MAKAKPTKTERESQAELMRRKRSAARDLTIPKCKNPKRRAKAEADVFLWLRTYFAHRFGGVFSPDRKAMVEAILHRTKFGGDQSIAAPRGEGKTTIAECVGLFCAVQGMIECVMIIGANGPAATLILDEIKFELETNDTLAEDYPEICYPIRALEGAAQRANSQTVDGERTLLRWREDHIILPTVKGSKCSGAIIAAKGIDAAVRGYRVRGKRPDFVIIDDPETRGSVTSDDEITKRSNTIETDIAGLGGPRVRISRVMLVTIMNRKCLSFKYTDREAKPSWNGKRYRMIEKFPDRRDLWDEYIGLRQSGMETGDDIDGREAGAFYLANREPMDEGGVASNPERFVEALGEDGEPTEYSAMQHAFNIIADRGWDHFATEYQSEPPEENVESSGITDRIVRSRINGLDRCVIPPDRPILTAGIDCGKKALHWTVVAWQRDGTGDVIDYGVTETINPQRVGTEAAIQVALHQWHEETKDNPYCDTTGEVRSFDRILVDAGNWDRAVTDAVVELGGVFNPSKGFGDSVKSPFRQSKKNTREYQNGERWYRKFIRGSWLVGMDADYWKEWLQERFIASPLDDDRNRRPGTVCVFGDDPNEHVAYSKHITCEIRVEEFVEGRGVRRRWKTRGRNNHWLDSTYAAAVAASMSGVRLGQSTTPKPVRPKRRRRSGGMAGGGGFVGGGGGAWF